MANKALKEAARELERRETLAREDHTIPKGGLAAEVQVRASASIVYLGLSAGGHLCAGGWWVARAMLQHRERCTTASVNRAWL